LVLHRKFEKKPRQCGIGLNGIDVTDGTSIISTLFDKATSVVELGRHVDKPPFDTTVIAS
jgi:hypothetical protein